MGEGPGRALLGLVCSRIVDEWSSSVAEEKSPEDAARSGNPQVAAEGRAAKTKKTRSRDAKKKNSLATTRSWVVPTFLTLLLLGVAWLVVWYLTTSTGNRVPFMTDLGNWNMLIAMVLMGASFGVATLWK
ncbi:cell division protein CrgA [Propioniciclava flava]|uniref:cell division protein CrgA n=1 Tax=Propioniciclava flava TaxID=2072026 RepID=UPI003D7469B3